MWSRSLPPSSIYPLRLKALGPWLVPSSFQRVQAPEARHPCFQPNNSRRCPVERASVRWGPGYDGQAWLPVSVAGQGQRGNEEGVKCQRG